LIYLLTYLHEDLNRVTNKKTSPKIKNKDWTDFTIAKLSWERHLKRNDSIIYDLFGG